MKMLKKNQVVIYVVALMLVVAGYLNYSATNDLGSTIQTSSTEEEAVGIENVVNQINDSNSGVMVNNSNTNTNAIDNPVQNQEKASTSEEIARSTNNIGDAQLVSSNAETDYFSTSKLERDTMYSQMIETYENILSNSNSLETQKQSAQEEIKKINDIKNSIMICENLIKTKGLDQCVIFVNGESVSVVIGAEELTQEQIAQVQNIVSREMNAQVENIHISTK